MVRLSLVVQIRDYHGYDWNLVSMARPYKAMSHEAVCVVMVYTDPAVSASLRQSADDVCWAAGNDITECEEGCVVEKLQCGYARRDSASANANIKGDDDVR